MDRLYHILEEAQTVINQDDKAFNANEQSPLNFPSSMSSTLLCPLPSPSPGFKPFAHKVNKSANKLPNKSANTSVKKRTWKKPKDKPKRPLSAYNLFFQHERKNIIAVLPKDKSLENDGLTEEQRRRKHRKTHGKIGFADLARNIALKWKTIDKSAKSIFEARANIDRVRYKKEVDAWKKTQTDSGERVKAEKKKKTPSVPVPKSRPKSSTKSSTKSLENPKAADQPEALSSLLNSNLSAKRAQLVQCMWNNQFQPPQFHQQDTNVGNVHQVLMASCSEHLLHHQRGNFQQPHRLSQPNNICANTIPPTNELNMADLMSLSYITSAAHQRHAPTSEAFLKDSFFEYVADTTSPKVFSDSDESESSMEEDLDAFIDDFDSEILLH
jgi:hypothetical protein